MLLILMLMNFNPLIKLLLFVPQGEGQSFFSFVRGTNLFSVSKFTCSPKKESEKLKNSHFGQIHVQFLLFTVSYWVSALHEHSLWIHISQLSHWTALWPFRTVPLQRPQSALQFVEYQGPSPDSVLGGGAQIKVEPLTGPRQAKMCLREFVTRWHSNQTAQLQRLARIL